MAAGIPRYYDTRRREEGSCYVDVYSTDVEVRHKQSAYVALAQLQFINLFSKAQFIYNETDDCLEIIFGSEMWTKMNFTFPNYETHSPELIRS